MTSDDSSLRFVLDDGLYLPQIKDHSLAKISTHNSYAQIFARAMNEKWPQLAYVGLYCGAGRARVAESNQIVETSAMSALRLSPGFTHYIFVDEDQRCTDALERRVAALAGNRDVTILTGDANDKIDDVCRALPIYSRDKGLLSLCFVDPFAANVRFSTIRALAKYRMDLLILLMDGRDVRTNFNMYFGDESNERIRDLVDDPNWRMEWSRLNEADRDVVRYVITKFDAAMQRIGYLSGLEHGRLRVTIPQGSTTMYHVLFYSKSSLGRKLWEAALKKGRSQTLLDLDGL